MVWYNSRMSRRTATEIVDDVERRVSDGSLEPGERLPSSRSLADELGIAPNTAAAAYRRLRERGVVVGRGRQGTIVAARTTVAAKPHARIPDDVIDAASGNPDLSLIAQPSADMLVDALQPAAKYGDAMVTPELHDAGIQWLRADGLVVERVTVANGAMDAIERILQSRCSIGDRVAVEDPGHGPVYRIVAALGLVAVPMQIDERGILPKELAQALASGVRAVVITPRAQNPTGAAINAQRCEALRSVLDRYPEALIIEDDHAGPAAGVDVHYVHRGATNQRVRWAVVRSVAKSLGPDSRLALIAGDSETLDRLEGRLQLGAGWVSHFLQRVVAAQLSNPATAEAIRRAAERYRDRRERMVASLAAHGVAATGKSGFQVWIPVADEVAVVSAVQAEGFAIRSSVGYRLSSAPAVRVTVCALTDDQIDRIAQAIAGALRPAASVTLTV